MGAPLCTRAVFKCILWSILPSWRRFTSTRVFLREAPFTKNRQPIRNSGGRPLVPFVAEIQRTETRSQHRSPRRLVQLNPHQNHISIFKKSSARIPAELNSRFRGAQTNQPDHPTPHFIHLSGRRAEQGARVAPLPARGGTGAGGPGDPGRYGAWPVGWRGVVGGPDGSRAAYRCATAGSVEVATHRMAE